MIHCIDTFKFLFCCKEKKLERALYNLLGFYPHNLALYKQALMHRSSSARDKSGTHLHNERLEFLGDAILEAASSAILYRRFEDKREDFLTEARSKIVRRKTLNTLAEEIGLNKLMLGNRQGDPHNNIGGNAFEALIGAIYLDRGYSFCLRFLQEQICDKYLDINRVVFTEQNHKSRLLEWGQRNGVTIAFRLTADTRPNPVAGRPPYFESEVLVNGKVCGVGGGRTKKESEQQAARKGVKALRAQRERPVGTSK